jgi:plasmid stabilization system protein ParE
MSRYELTRSALADIDELWTYIAEDSVEAADRVSSAILDACQLLAEQPLIGHTREDLTPRPVLFWSSGRYLIVYRPETEPLRIVAIFHGARDVASLLTDRE